VVRSRPGSLLLKLLVAYLLPTVLLFSIFGWLAYRVTERSLEQSLGRRLIAVAQATAVQIRPAAVRFMTPGEDDSLTARRQRKKLKALRTRTSVARILILDAELRSRLDTHPAVLIGDRYYHAEADRTELKRVFATRHPASSVLFAGADGRIYMTGYAPLLDDGEVVAAIGVAGSAEFFSVLASLRNTLLITGAVVVALVIAICVLVARRITRPLRRLADEAARIGAGDLERPVAVQSSDEVGLLAGTMNEMRQGLYERDQQLQMMLSGIAHEVRNPLGGIELFSGILRDELSGDPDKLEHLARIERELAYLEKVVSDFLDFARRSPPTLTRVELRALASEIIELSRRDADGREVALELEGGPEVWAHADPEQLRRALLNLVRNAVQATPVGGRVTLTCATRGDRAEVAVQDTGEGVDPELLERIFTPFFTTREKGTGLGLAFAKKIVDEHGGALTVEGRPEGGARFAVALPIAPREPGGRRSAAERPSEP
jgi:signal transduction histidine kinase